MKRKFFLTILTVIMVGSCAIGLAACGSSNEKDTHKHQLQHFDAVSATCTEDGNKEYWHCSACGKYFSDAQATAETDQSKTIIPAKGHTFSKNWSHDDTYHWHACQNCDEVSDKAEHAWESGVVTKQPTCTEDGTRERECFVCNATGQETIFATEHAFPKDWSYDDTYHWHACQNCDEVSDKAEHTRIDGICSVCGAPEPSIGLGYILNNAGTGYSVNGIGTCTDADIVIPSTYNGLPVTSVEEAAFFNCYSITGITLPDSIISIGRIAFANCSALTSVIIPDSVIDIKDSAFSGCRSLESITLPDSITSIERYVFNSCYALESITIPDSVIDIEDYAFFCCTGLKSITIPSSVKSIGGYSFSYCTSLTGISIPENVTYIDEYAFNNCTALKNIVLHEKMGALMRGVFSYCTSLESITIPDSVIDISTHAFEKCSSLKEVIIGSGVISLSSYAFSYCTALESITIPENVKVIGDYTFAYCTALKNIDIGSGVTTIGKAVFSECTALTNVTFENTSGWRISSSSTETSGTIIPENDLANPSTAATYLKSTYCDYYWKRS